MATINLGSIKFNWKGAYAGGTAYAVDDVVSYNGSSYVCILASTGNLPTNGTYFSVMSQAGTDGTDGTDVGTTITTQGDILYRDGSGLQRLAKGTASQVLAINSGATAPEWVDAPSGVIKKIHVFSKSTRGTGSGSANTNAFIWSTGFTPLDPTNNSMKITGIVPIDSAGNNFTGYGLRFSHSTNGNDYDFNGYGVMYTSYNLYQGIQSYIFSIPANTLPAGTYTIYHRLYAIDSNAEVYFPNSNEDSRLSAQTRGDLIIEEYKN